jgi:hypothetical protein
MDGQNADTELGVIQIVADNLKRLIFRTNPIKMSKEEFLALAASRYEALNKLNEIKDFYTYEATFDEIWTDLGQSVLERNIGKVGEDRRKKNESEADTEK